ncbi:arsenate reductase (glutaredoxin) [Zobellia galactanivorans]|uniref:Arsenate reductase n=1 Tax=Zobellia galactanivorans (strain DSM 12802 / CCUG 47099 / CIP 106680 / NCIMB 13871 / Dsij) TaxID=63186 RepID=G0L2H8_ZOBGA|nr:MULTISPECIES: arsenate reductase (glutaredoxin) [Zobellia]MDO6807756.1 arsenate reductase (glutaredoxin) [Zobellia galactanivorans]OWW25561.1 arsenate reductase (glutaredoxin) [Zobellia sp. OII3]CAZ98179.1 Arsenate reductase [Zobellia galactanivorans]
MIKIYHNPRCQKSREGLHILEQSGKEFEVIKYLEDVPSKEELRKVLDCLGITPEMLVRKNEAIWKENYRGKLLSQEEILDAMILHPKLIERPIVVNGGKAVIGRPPKLVEDIL